MFVSRLKLLSASTVCFRPTQAINKLYLSVNGTMVLTLQFSAVLKGKQNEMFSKELF